MAAINGINAQILAASGTSTVFADEAMTDSGDHIHYTITNAAHRYWDDTVAVVMQESTDSGSTWHAAPGTFTLSYPGGKLTYSSARSAGNLYRAHSGNYFTITTIGGGHEWDVTFSTDLYDVTEFGSAWHSFIDGNNGGTASISRFWVDTYFWALVLTGSARLIVALYTSTVTGQRYEGYAFIKQNTIKVPEAGVVDGTVGFTLDKTLYYNPGP